MKNIFCFLIFLSVSIFNSSIYAYNNTDSLSTTNIASSKMDSVFSKLLNQSSLALQDMLQRNQFFLEQGKTDSMQFVLNLNFDLDASADVPYFSQKATNFVSNAKSTELDTYLSGVFTREAIAPYLLFVTLNYKPDIKLSEAETISNIINYDKVVGAGKKDIELEYLKSLHNRLVSELEKQLPTAADKKWIFTNVGNYIAIYPDRKYSVMLYANKYKNLEPVIINGIESSMKGKLEGGTITYPGNDAMADNFVAVIENSIKLAKLKERILGIRIKDELCQFFLNNALFPVNSDKGYVSESYKILSLEERKHCLKLLIGADWVNVACINKPTILALLRNTPQQDIPAIFSFLKDKVPNNYNNRGKSYIYLLIANTSDGLFSSDYTHVSLILNLDFKNLGISS